MPTQLAVGEATALDNVEGDWTFLPIHAQQFSDTRPDLIDGLASSEASSAGQQDLWQASPIEAWAPPIAEQQILLWHKAAHTPGAIALPKRKQAHTSRVSVTAQERVVTT